MKSTADVGIIGAGVIGCSTAYHLAARGIVDVAVVEMGQVGSGSTSKSAAMLSLQFCHDELSARLAQLSYARYMRFEEEVGVPIDFKPTGWLSVGTASDAAELLKGARMLNRLGVATEVLDPAEIKRQSPEIRVDDLVVGTFGPDYGPFDDYMIVWGMPGGRWHWAFECTRACGPPVSRWRAGAWLASIWTGVRPLTPDGRPILGPTPGVEGFLLSCGWGGVGIIQAPMAGLLAAEVAANGRATAMDIEPLSIERFGGAA